MGRVALALARGVRARTHARAPRSARQPPTRAPSVHVVGTNGKSTATRTIAALFRADGLDVGAYTSPHVAAGTSASTPIPSRSSARSEDPRRGRSGERHAVRGADGRRAATSRSGLDAAVVEAGLGGRLDATNVLDAPVVLLTNVGLEHTDVLGDTREQIAREKLAVVEARARSSCCPTTSGAARSRSPRSVSEERARRPRRSLRHPIDGRGRGRAARPPRAARARRGP